MAEDQCCINSGYKFYWKNQVQTQHRQVRIPLLTIKGFQVEKQLNKSNFTTSSYVTYPVTYQ